MCASHNSPDPASAPVAVTGGAPQAPVAPDRVRSLLDRMPGRRPVLLALLGYCADPRDADEVAAFVDAQQERNRSVYTPARLCSLLEEAGGLERLDADGNPFDETCAEPEPQVVVVDGVECFEPAAARALFWHTTPAGARAAAADDPLARLDAMLADDEAYLPIYERVLTLCSEDGGALTRALGEAVDHDPLVQEPRYFVQRFVERLEQCGALAWDGSSWCTTELGLRALEKLATR